MRQIALRKLVPRTMWIDAARRIDGHSRSGVYPRPCQWCGQHFPAGHALFTTRSRSPTNEPSQHICVTCLPELGTLELEISRLEMIAKKWRAISATSNGIGHTLISMDARLLITAYIYGGATNMQDNMMIRTKRWIDCGYGFCPLCGPGFRTRIIDQIVTEALLLDHQERQTSGLWL